MLSVITIHLLHLSLNQSDFEAFLCSSCRRSSYTSIFIYTYIHRPLDFIHLTSILLKLVDNFFFFFSGKYVDLFDPVLPRTPPARPHLFSSFPSAGRLHLEHFGAWG